ncbi:hypothetical protein [Sphingobium sp. YR768]|uniref:hypothetical protein n=1 Tax=Sphingobium sp. YR768 TaxID=1884365 RepID=UPI0008AFF8BD|nr:hypothetical protein [Sphingobium sp. YR768]SEQ56502.1 hypothetical protein SAMN05518866_101358 [Sphingobium sp. YR768]
MDFKETDIVTAQIFIANAIGEALEKRGLLLREELANYVDDESSKLDSIPYAKYILDLTAKVLRQKTPVPPTFRVIDGGLSE